MDASLQTCDVCYKQVVANEHDPFAQLLCNLFPTIPIFFIEWIFNRNNGVFIDQFFIIMNHFIGGSHNHLTICIRCQTAAVCFTNAAVFYLLSNDGGTFAVTFGFLRLILFNDFCILLFERFCLSRKIVHGGIFLEQFACGSVHCKGDILSRLKACILNCFH